MPNIHVQRRQGVGLTTAIFCFQVVILLGPTEVYAQRPLFSQSEMPAPTAPFADATIVRMRYVTVDVDQLDNTNVGNGLNRTLLLNLFPDVSHEAVLDRVDRVGSALVWVGHVVNSEASSVTLSIEHRTVYGRITVGEATYLVRLVKDQVHAVVQIDPAAFPPERAPIHK